MIGSGQINVLFFTIGSCKKKMQSKSGARCPAYGGLVCTVSVAQFLNMSLTI